MADGDASAGGEGAHGAGGGGSAEFQGPRDADPAGTFYTLNPQPWPATLSLTPTP